jgi:glycosyltransferase involved in cell wall biosynthesis
MKILVLSQYYYPEQFLINDIVDELSKVHHITVLTGKPNYPRGIIYKNYKRLHVEISEINNLKVIRVPIIPRKNCLFFLTLNYFSFILSTLFITPFIIKKNNFDVILSYGLSPPFQSLGLIILNFYYRKPFVTWIQDLWPDSFIRATDVNLSLINFFINILNKFIYSRNDLLLVQSTKFSDFIEKLAPKTLLCYLPNPAPSALTNYINKESLLVNNKKKFKVIFAGNLGKVQGLDVLLDAAHMLNQEGNNIELHIYGSGSYEKVIRYTIREKKLSNVFIYSQVSLEEISKKLSTADALLLSLINDPILNLTIPSKLQAYMCMGKPIIGVVSGEARKIILEAKCGITVEPGNVIGLYSAFQEISTLTSDQLDSMGKLGKKYYCENFSIQKIVSQLDFLLKELLK